MILHLLILMYLANKVVTQLTDELRSICPNVFRYENRTEPDKWYGIVNIQSPHELSDIWIGVELDHKAELLGNWFGETFSSDNKHFRIINPDYVLQAGPPVSIRFFIKYNQAGPIPRVEKIRLNGKTICSSKRNEVKQATPQLHISYPRPTTSSPTSVNNEREYQIRSGIGEETYKRPSDDRDTTSHSYNRPNRPNGDDQYVPSYPSVNNEREYQIRPGIGEETNKRPSGDRDTTSHSYNRPNRPNGGQDVPSYPSINRRVGDLDSTPHGYNPSGSDERNIYAVGNRPSDSTNHSYDGPVKHSFAEANYTRVIGSDTTILNYNEDAGSNHNPIESNQDNDQFNLSKPKNNESDEDFFPGDFNVLKVTSNVEHTNKNPLNIHKTISCGTVALRPKPFIANGQDTIPGEWPWHSAIYHSKGIQLVYICGASLISERHVLTAAHCVTKANSNRKVEPESLLVYFGKYNLKTFGPETQDSDISDIFVHPEFNFLTYNNDVAIIKLSRPIEITDYVRPVCLWEGSTDLENMLNKEGTVIGWGFDENKRISEKLMQAKMPIVSTIQCIYSNRAFFAHFTFDKNFCAGFRNGTSVCNGDSGGSMVFPKTGSSGQNTVWQIRGIISVGVALQTEGICDTSQYVMFTDVAKYLKWIKQIVYSN